MVYKCPLHFFVLTDAPFWFLPTPCLGPYKKLLQNFNLHYEKEHVLKHIFINKFKNWDHLIEHKWEMTKKFLKNGAQENVKNNEK
jgi:hypothetical protein